MNIISYGLANKAAKEEKKTRYDVLGEGVSGPYQHVKERIDFIEKAIEGINDKANQAIVQNAINIMKANAKLNAIAQSKRYQHYHMVFDDFLDNSGIDLEKSDSFSHNQTLGVIRNNRGTDIAVVTVPERTEAIVEKMLLVPEYLVLDQEMKFFVSRNNGETWEQIEPEKLFFFHDSISPKGNEIRLKAVMPPQSEWYSYGLTWY